MADRPPRYSQEEFAQRGRNLYESSVRSQFEVASESALSPTLVPFWASRAAMTAKPSVDVVAPPVEPRTF